VAELQSFSTGAGEVLVQVEAASGGSPSLDEALGVVASLAGALAGQIAAVPPESAPDEMQAGFDLVAVEGGRFAIAQGAGNIRVTLIWSGDAVSQPDIVDEF
jgi:hypothetical protein